MGSLFQAREWWSTRCGADEEFDRNCLCCGNVDNDAEGNAKIVVGSFAGIVRVYLPRHREYSVQDLIVEQDVGAPVLQVAIGRFTPKSPELALAVLLPRQLVVFAVHGMIGDSVAPAHAKQDEKQYYSLTRLYHHEFERTAASFCYGSFGHAPGTSAGGSVYDSYAEGTGDELCVQSMDGCLRFFRQDEATFHRFLPDFLLPGPLVYAPELESFITSNSQMMVCCYKHHMLAASHEDKHEAGGDAASVGGAAGKRVRATWTANVGEHVLDIRVGRFTETTSRATDVDVIVLGERTLYCIDGSGEIKMQKRLEFVPQCLCPFTRSLNADGVRSDALLLGAATPPKILVYKGSQLEWVCGVPNVPINMQVCQFGGLQGLIVCLDATGQLSVNYLGTDPPNNVVATDDKGALNYDEMDQEHRKLLGVIRAATSDMKAEPSDRVMLRADVPTRLDAMRGDDAAGSVDARGDWRSRVVTARLSVTYTGADCVEQLQIAVSATEPVVVSQEMFVIEKLQGNGDGRGRTPLVLPIEIRVRGDLMPTNLTLPVVATYLTKTGEPRSARWEMTIPLCLVCTVVPPVKAATFKVRLETNHAPPAGGLTSLFEDVLSLSSHGAGASAANVMTFQYFCGLDVTLMASKSNNKYRLQSNHLHAMWLLLTTLVTRLRAYFQGSGGAGEGGGGEPLIISAEGPLPLPAFFGSVDAHLAARHELAHCATMLEQRSHQFRSVQKRLLQHFKARNPAPLSHLEELLGASYTQLLRVSEVMDERQHALKVAANVLSCSVYLLLQLMRLQYELDDEDYSVLEAYMSPDVIDNPSQGWEETTDAALTSMLRSALSKRDMVDNIVHLEEALDCPADSGRLQKHVNLMCERLASGEVGTRLRKLKERGGAGVGEMPDED